MFGAQVTWQYFPFGPISASFLPVVDFYASAAVKLESDEENGCSRVTGRELQTCSVTLKACKMAGAHPRETYEILCKLKGTSAPIYVSNGVMMSLSNVVLDTLQTSDWTKVLTLDNAEALAKSLLFGSSLGGVSYMLISVSMEPMITLPNGDIIDAYITLVFEEDAGQRQTGGLKVYINDKDVTKSIAVTSCVYECHAEGCADTLDITFADSLNQWTKWKPDKSRDTIKITDGRIGTGKLHINTLAPKNGLYVMRASSVPNPSKNKKSKSFENVSLPQIAQAIAEENGLQIKNYGVLDTKYPYVQRRGVSGLAFLHERCKLAGASFLVFDGTLCIYDEKTMESREPGKTIAITPKSNCTLYDDTEHAYSTAKISNSTFVGTATDSGISTGKQLVLTVTEKTATQAEANRLAQALLRNANKNARRGEMTMALQRELSAGSVIRLVGSGWLGNAFIYRCRHDLKTKQTKIWFRKPLDY